MARCDTQAKDKATTTNNWRTPGASDLGRHNLADDALEQLIKSKEEAEIFNDLPLFDVAIIHNFIDEWFASPNLSFDDLQLPIGLSVSFNGAIASELALAQRIVELKHKIDYEKAQFKKHVDKLSVQDVKNFKIMLHELKESFLKKCEEAKGSRERIKNLADKWVPDPPARQVEVENLQDATTNTNEANDVVMADANVEPAPTSLPEANVA